MKVSDTKESPEKEPEQEDRPYEDVDGSTNAMLCSGLQRAVPNLPPPRHPERMKVSDTKESPEKEPEQEDRKYEDVDPHGESIFGSSSGLQRAVPTLPPPRRHESIAASDTMESPEEEPEQEDRKYEDVDVDANAMLGPGLQRTVPTETSPPHLDIGDHVVVCPGDTMESPEEEPEQEDRKYEDVDVDANAMLGPGLQRTVPTETSPPHLDIGDHVVVCPGDTMESPEEEPEQEDRKYEDVDVDANAMLGPGLQRTVPTETSPPHLDIGDHVVVCPEFNEDTSHDTSYTQEDADRNEESGAPSVDNKAGARKTKRGPVALPDSQDDPETSGIRNVNERQQSGDARTDDSTPKTEDCNSSGLIHNAIWPDDHGEPKHVSYSTRVVDNLQEQHLSLCLFYFTVFLFGTVLDIYLEIQFLQVVGEPSSELTKSKRHGSSNHRSAITITNLN
ncbi:Hypp7380 [Branchiostoma lanceolatum]|uniref:Hypp7380 protein n=1 Tax=Branchiostoma lanceolatum TaxID=7740 RepID=A0A8K0ED70_BRALA|nr:Hypp7380 [Branchiostoma lanceolatum]